MLCHKGTADPDGYRTTETQFGIRRRPVAIERKTLRHWMFRTGELFGPSSPSLVSERAALDWSPRTRRFVTGSPTASQTISGIEVLAAARMVLTRVDDGSSLSSPTSDAPVVLRLRPVLESPQRSERPLRATETPFPGAAVASACGKAWYSACLGRTKSPVRIRPR